MRPTQQRPTNEQCPMFNVFKQYHQATINIICLYGGRQEKNSLNADFTVSVDLPTAHFIGNCKRFGACLSGCVGNCALCVAAYIILSMFNVQRSTLNESQKAFIV
jgi:hypothetical protein